MDYRVIGNNKKENIIEELFLNRNMSVEDMLKFLNTTDNDIIPADKLDNIELGAKLLKKHIDNKSNILIVVDCDVDGLTSSAILWNYLKDIVKDIKLSYVMHEGKLHGLSEDLYENVLEKEYNLCILPDASSNNYEQHKILKDNGIDILVLDHHKADYYSENAVVINNQMSKEYSNKKLSGAGVVWQFIRYFTNYYNIDVDINSYLDLVALGNVADVMDLRSIETKHLIMKGLSNVENSLFKTICSEQSYSMKNKITPMSVAWYVAPLLNAMIRVGSRKEKEDTFSALLKENSNKEVVSTKRGHLGEMELLQKEVTRLCKNARNRQNKIVEENIVYINKKIDELDLTKNKILIITIPQDKMPSELVGLVANKIASERQQPTLILREVNDKLIGSGRNFANSPVNDFRYECENSGLFELAQGHPSAWGCIISKDNLEKVISYFNDKWKEMKFSTCYKVDFEFDLLNNESSFGENSVSKLKKCIKSIGELNRLGIWGQGLPEPVIALKNVPLSNIQIMSPDKKPSLKIIYKDISIIKFGVSQKEIEQLKDDGVSIKIADIVGTCNLNEWGGKTSLQILVTDYEVTKTMYYF